MLAAALLAMGILLPFPFQAIAGVRAPGAKKQIRAAPDVSILFFTAAWCEPCRAVDPILEKFSRKHERNVKLVLVDFDSAREEAARWDVRAIPVVIVVSAQGKILLRCDGAERRTLSTLESALEDIVKRRRERSKQL